MAAAGLYSVGGAFWEFGEPDWELTKLFLLIGVAEDHDSNPIKLGLGRLKQRGAKIISINPVRSGYSAIADEFVGIRPGTDGLLVLALIHCLLEAGQIDLDFLVRYTNAHYLAIDAPGDPDHGLFARDKQGKPLAYDRRSHGFVDAEAFGTDPALLGTFRLPDGRSAQPAFAGAAERYLSPEFSPEAVAARCGVPATTAGRTGFAQDSSLEGDGFELSVPRVMEVDLARQVPALIAVFELAGTAVTSQRGTKCQRRTV